MVTKRHKDSFARWLAPIAPIGAREIHVESRHSFLYLLVTEISGRMLGFMAGLVLSVHGMAAAAIVAPNASADTFPLVSSAAPAPIWFDANDATVVSIAARDLAADIERVTGQKPAVMSSGGGAVLRPASGGSAPVAVVLIGTLGHSSLIDDLVRTGKLDATQLVGRWETFLIATVDHPRDGVDRAFVIAGSDRRGTAFGVYELSQQIGVSPWHWWADVPVKTKLEIHLRAGATLMGPPSVKYRGIFINDEDWGLQPWAAQTFAPEEGGIGPKVYRKVFELLLRLKANTLWPAMHACTKPFNAFPENKQLADDYGIVMGSSHAEPMLRNNVSEWTAPHEEYNYVTNRDGVLQYWEERVAANGHFENIYTVGMRGIHDSAIQGTKTDVERIAVLERVFADQRALLAEHVSPDVEQVPQMFCAYKEVLDLYRQGLKVPDDVTIVWPDDNFGYIRNFATPEEQRTRTGGFGVYYHISYLGRPMAYLWLNTTPPALLWEEMTKAYDHGAREIWIVNVGDIKPAEIGAEFFLQMAWDINRWNRQTLPNFLEEWATREFGAEHAGEIAGIMRDYYQLNFQRKPEHLQWWLPREEPRPSPLTRAEIRERLAMFAALQDKVHGLAPAFADRASDAFMQLVGYPVLGAALANHRYAAGELLDPTMAQGHDALLGLLTESFNGRTAEGKWSALMQLEPADDDWRSMRIAPWTMPAWSAKDEDAAGPPCVIAMEAENFDRIEQRDAVGWAILPDLGRTGPGSVSVVPFTAAGIDEAKLARDAPRLEYDITFTRTGDHTFTAYLIPTHPLVAGRGLRFAVGLDDQPPQVLIVPREVGDSAWSQGVLNNTVTGSTTINVPVVGRHVLKVYMVDAGVVLDKIVINCGGLKPSYLGPPETRLVVE